MSDIESVSQNIASGDWMPPAGTVYNTLLELAQAHEELKKRYSTAVDQWTELDAGHVAERQALESQIVGVKPLVVEAHAQMTKVIMGGGHPSQVINRLNRIKTILGIKS